MEVERISIGDIIESGKLNGRVTGMIWTGFPSAEVIGEIPISEDSNLDKEYKRLLQELESLCAKYRKMTMNELETGFKTIEDRKSITDKIASLLKELSSMEKYKIRTDVMLVAFAATYETISKTNPTEVKNLSVGAKQQIKQIQQICLEFENPIVFHVIDKKQLKDRVITLLTVGQAKKFTAKNNMKELRKLVEEVMGVKNLSDESIRNIIEGISASLFIADAAQVFKSVHYGSFIYQAILYNYLFELYKADQGLPVEERKYPELTPDYIAELGDLHDLFDLVTEKYQYNFQTENDFHAKLQCDYIYDNIEFIDIEKLFMAFLVRCMDTLESVQIQTSRTTREQLVQEHARVVYECEIDTDNGNYDIAEITKLCEVRKNIMEALLKISKLPNNFTYQIINEENDDALEEITVARIREKMQKFCGKYYLNDSIMNYLRLAIFKSRHKELIEDSELMSRLGWNESEIQTLSMVDSSILKKFLEIGYMNPELLKQLALKVKNGEIDEILEDSFHGEGKQAKEEIEFHKFMKENLAAQNISVLEFIDEYFVEGIVSEEDVLELSEEEIKKVVNQDTLKQVYQMYATQMASHHTNSSKEDEEQIQKLRKKVSIYTKLFEKHYLKDFSEEEQDIVKKEFIEEFYLDLVGMEMPDEEISPLVAFVINEMLNNDFVNYLTIYETSFMGTYITELRKRNIFSLEETRKIKEALGSQRCKEIIDGIISAKDLSQNQKFALIMDFFFQNADLAIRDELVGKLEFFDPEFFKARGERSGKPILSDELEKMPEEHEENPDSTKYTKHLYSDGIKWEFYHSIMDKDIKATTYSNGYVEFYSPRLGKRFIEKFYIVDKKTSKIVAPGYGVATYVVDDEVYVANRDRLVECVPGDGKEAINPVVLAELVPRGRHTRIPHITQSTDKNWMRLMVAEYGSIYSQADRDLLEAKLAEYENQHEIID